MVASLNTVKDPNWGRIGFAVANAGVDIISGLFDNEAGMEAYNRGKNGYY